MIDLSRMLSCNTEALKFESCTTLPCSVALESNAGKHTSYDSEVETDCSATAPTSRDVANHDGVRSAPSHFSPQVTQTLTEKLLDNSEQCTLDDSLVFECSVVDDWSEAASGWGVVVPYPKYVTQQPPVRHKPQSALKKGSVGGRTAIRCVDEDFGSEHLCPSWKGNIEPVTYRYVPNNGYYRSHKPIKDMREWAVISKKSKSERSRMTPEMRLAQKTLKRDLESHFRSSNEDSPSTNNTAPVNHTANDKCQDIPVKSLEALTEQRFCISEMTRVSKRLPAREQQLMKSASDLFMEKFNTRLCALEKELQIPCGPAVSKKSTEPACASNHFPIQLSKKLKEVRVPETMKPTVQSTKQHGGDFGNNLFTVTPMSKPEVALRPLEKLTPNQKQMEKNSLSSGDRSPSPELSSAEKKEDMIMLACATSQPPPLPKDHDSSGVSTARSAIAMTNFDIEKMRNIPLRSEYNSKPKPFVVQKDSGGRGTMRYTVTGSGSSTQPSDPAVSRESVERKDLLPCVDRPAETKVGTVSNPLPEIMGKRLSVITATHRLL